MLTKSSFLFILIMCSCKLLGAETENMKKFFVSVFLVLISLSAYAAEKEEPTVVRFNNLFTFKASLNYNYNYYFIEPTEEGDNYGFQTYQPLVLGLGFGIKNIFLSFYVSIPIFPEYKDNKSQTFNFAFNHYNRNRSFFNGYVKYYNGFFGESENNAKLSILNIGLVETFILNRDHPLRTIYNLDGRQTRSNGSFLIGGRLLFTAVRSNRKILHENSREQYSFYFGPTLGYSYTFVIGGNFFINLLANVGLDFVFNDGYFSPGFQAMPKFAIGYHGKKWSVSLVNNFSYLLGDYSSNTQYNLISGDIGLFFRRRFL